MRNDSGTFLLVTALAFFSISARAQNVTTISIRDNIVQAFFTSIDPSGCVETDAVVVANTQSVRQMPDGSRTTAPFSALSLTTIDFCAGAQIDAFGSTDTFTLQMDGISTAVFQATIPMLEINDAAFGFAHISASWDASGQVTTLTFNQVIKSPGLVTVDALAGSFRNALSMANISASYSDGVTMSLSGPSQFANLGKTTEGDITIIRP